VQATRLAASFEPLPESVALVRPEKFPRKALCVSVFFFSNPRKRPDAKVLTLWLPAYEDIIPGNQPKTAVLELP